MEFVEGLVDSPMIQSLFQVISNYGGDPAVITDFIAKIVDGEVFQAILAGLTGIIGSVAG